MMMALGALLLLMLLQLVTAEVNELGQESYDIDSSWAIHSTKLADTFGDAKQALCTFVIRDCRCRWLGLRFLQRALAHTLYYSLNFF